MNQSPAPLDIEKAKQYRIARLTPKGREVFTDCLDTNGIVKVEFYNVIYNAQHKRDEILYIIRQNYGNEFLGYAYANALTDFSL